MGFKVESTTTASGINALNYVATWNASTNSPSLSTGVGNKGDLYIVTASGSTSLDGIGDWEPRDMAFFDGGVWRKIDSSDQDTIHFQVPGPLSVNTGVGVGWVAPRPGTIRKVSLYRAAAGSSGSTIVDINKNNTTIFTTQANRPSVTAAAGNGAKFSTTAMDVTSFTTDDVITADADAVEGGSPTSMAITVEVTYP